MSGARRACEHCGRRVGQDNLILSRDPWDEKEKWVCADSTACYWARRDSLARPSAPSPGEDAAR